MNPVLFTYLHVENAVGVALDVGVVCDHEARRLLLAASAMRQAQLLSRSTLEPTAH